MDLQVNVQLKIARPAHRVFEAIADPEKLSRYFVSRSTGPLREETAITWSFKDEKHDDLDVKVTRVERDRLISFLWAGSGTRTVVEITLHAESESATLVKVRENGWGKTDRGIAALAESTQVWTGFLFGLKVFLEHGVSMRKRADNIADL